MRRIKRSDRREDSPGSPPRHPDRLLPARGQSRPHAPLAGESLAALKSSSSCSTRYRSASLCRYSVALRTMPGGWCGSHRHTDSVKTLRLLSSSFSFLGPGRTRPRALYGRSTVFSTTPAPLQKAHGCTHRMPPGSLVRLSVPLPRQEGQRLSWTLNRFRGCLAVYWIPRRAGIAGFVSIRFLLLVMAELGSSAMT